MTLVERSPAVRPSLGVFDADPAVFRQNFGHMPFALRHKLAGNGLITIDRLTAVAEKMLATGRSQSAFRLVTYINAVHPLAHLFDGFLVHSRGSSPAPLFEGADGRVPANASRQSTTTNSAPSPLPAARAIVSITAAVPRMPATTVRTCGEEPSRRRSAPSDPMRQVGR